MLFLNIDYKFFLKKSSLIVFVLLLLNSTNYAMAQDKNVNISTEKSQVDNANTNKSAEQSIDFSVKQENKPVIKSSDHVTKIDTPLYENNQEKTKKAFETQKKMDIDDLQALWAATIERNIVVKFAIRKLTLPAESRRIHSSLFARSVSTLISGVSILPSLLGADNITSISSSVTGRAVSRYIDKKNSPKEMPLTDTELIKLQQTIENLEDRIIKSYYEYKSSIESLKVCRQNLLLQNTNYSNALKSGQEISILASSALYDKELLNELKLEQEIKLYRLELERLAGSKVVDNLNLGKITSLDNKTQAQPQSTSNDSTCIKGNSEKTNTQVNQKSNTPILKAPASGEIKK